MPIFLLCSLHHPTPSHKVEQDPGVHLVKSNLRGQSVAIVGINNLHDPSVVTMEVDLRAERLRRELPM